MKERKWLAGAVASAGLLAGVLTGLLFHGKGQAAQGAYPERPITLVVPYPAGAAVDNVGRQVGAALHRALGQPVVVENRAGAGSQIGTAHVAKAAADGHTLLITTLDALTLLPLVRDLPYRPDQDLTAVARVARIPYAIQANPGTGIASLAQLLDKARANPGALRYGSTGNGSLAHVAMAQFADRAGIDLVHVPYRGMAASVNDLIAGHIDLGVVSTATIAPHVASGRVQPVALMADQAHPMWPGIPALGDLGFKGVEAELEFVIVAPAATPPEIIARLSGVLGEALRTDAFRQALEAQGMSPAYLDAAQLQARTRDDAARWTAAVAGMDIDKTAP